MAFLSSSRRHFSASAKNKLRNVFDPDKALSILSSSSSSSSSSSYRFAVDLTVRRLARSRRFADIETLLQDRRAHLPDPTSEPSLAPIIITYGVAGMLSHARNLFDEIPQKTSLSFNALLSACAKSKKPKLVPDLFRDLPSLHPSVVPDHVSYGILIKSLCLAGKLNQAQEAFGSMLDKNIAPTVPIYTTLIDSYYKKGKSDEAEKLWNEMVAKGLKLDHVAYNVRMMYSAEHGKPEEVLELIKESESAGWRPDAISYNYLISCYCRNGRFEDAKEAYRGFLKMTNSEPNAAMFKDLVGFLCGNGDFDGGLEVCRDSMKHNKIPDFKTMKVLVEGLAEKGKAEEVKEVIRVVKERFPDDLLGRWKSLEKQLGLVADGDGAAGEQLEAA